MNELEERVTKVLEVSAARFSEFTIAEVRNALEELGTAIQKNKEQENLQAQKFEQLLRTKKRKLLVINSTGYT